MQELTSAKNCDIVRQQEAETVAKKKEKQHKNASLEVESKRPTGRRATRELESSDRTMENWVCHCIGLKVSKPPKTTQAGLCSNRPMNVLHKLRKRERKVEITIAILQVSSSQN